MSIPFGVYISLISGQKHSREIAVAASTLLAMHYLTIEPIAEDGPIRDTFLKALATFEARERMFFREPPDYHVERLVAPGGNPSTKNFFWLALDPEGETLARKIFQTNGELPDHRAHPLVKKLNMIEQSIAPPPKVDVPAQVWEESRRKYSSLMASYRRSKPNESFRSYTSKQITPTPEQELYYVWFESLYESLIPWQDIIRTIQSDLS